MIVFSVYAGDSFGVHLWFAFTARNADQIAHEIIQFLKDSFAVGHRAAKTLTPENAAEQLPFFRGSTARLYIASGAVIHAADEYGQMVEYLRMNGIVPPASRGN